MNERIRELAEKARANVAAGLSVDEWIKEYNQQLGQLIVQECISIVADAVDQREPASTYVGKIKEHFGIDQLSQ